MTMLKMRTNQAKSHACSSPGAQPAVSVVSSAPGENERQKNNEYDEHLGSSLLQVATPGLCHRFDYAAP